MSSPPTHSPAIILSGIDDDDDDRNARKQLVPAAVAPAVPLRLRASPPASASPQERQVAAFAPPATAVLNALVVLETRGAGMNDVAPADIFAA